MYSRTHAASVPEPGVTQVSGRFGPGSAHAARGRPMNNLQLVENLCARSSVLSEARRVHVKSFGALIPHVFMGSVLARVGTCICAGKKAITDHGVELAAILESLEQGLAAGDRETRNVISVSFVNDGELEPFFAALKPLMGPRVRAQLQGR